MMLDKFRPVEIVVHTSSDYIKRMEEQRFEKFLDTVEGRADSRMSGDSKPSSPLAAMGIVSSPKMYLRPLLPHTIYDVADVSGAAAPTPTTDDEDTEPLSLAELGKSLTPPPVDPRHETYEVPPQLDAV